MQSDEKQAARQSAQIAKTDYRLLMVKRSGLSSFMASAYVYPGGAVEVADYSPKWWSVFSKVGVSRGDLSQFSSAVKGMRPPMITDPLTVQRAKAAGDLPSNADILPADVALRISAIRETFEETG